MTRTTPRPARKGLRAALAVTVGACGLWLLAPTATATTWQGRTVLDSGHVDAFHLTLDGDRLDLLLREDLTGDHVVHEPDDVVLHLTDAAILEVPEGLDPDYDFLGPAGSALWLIPEVQNPDVVWAGWNTEDIANGRLEGDALTLTVTSVENLSGGRDDLVIFDTRLDGGPRILVDTAAGDRDITVAAHTHAHANWVFFEPGVYELAVEARAGTTTGHDVVADATYRIAVGALPEEPSPSPTPTPTPSTPTPRDPPSPTPTPAPTPAPTPTAPGGDASQPIAVQVGGANGALTIAVEGEATGVVLPAARLDAGGSAWVSAGAMLPVVVSDTRDGLPGWNVVGRLVPAGGGGADLPPDALGWTPVVLAAPTGVTAGAPVAPTLDGGPGLGVGSVLAQASPGKARGATRLGATLALRLPASVAPGTYRGVLTLTVI